MARSLRFPFLVVAAVTIVLAPGCPMAGTKIAKAQSTVFTAMPPGGIVARPLNAAVGDIFNVRDYGALGTDSGTTIAQSGLFTTAQMASLAAMAAYTNANGAYPLAWMTNPLYGLTFTMTTTAAQTTASTTLTFTKSGTGQAGASWASEALWDDVNHGNYLLAPGMTVTDANGCIPAGTMLVSYNDNQADASYGSLVLSRSTSSACAAGDAVTFTITPAQLQALTMDYLGAQSAIAAAYSSIKSGVGGKVYFPAGNYNLNHDLVHPGQSDDTSNEPHDLLITGDGVTQSHLYITVDLGAAHCAIKEVTRDSPFHSGSTYRDLLLSGASGWTRVNGRPPHAMDGLCIGSSAVADHLSVNGFRAGINIVGNHTSMQNINSSNNGYGAYRAPFTLTMGNESIINSGLAGNTIASWAVSAAAQTDSSFFENIHTGFGPVGFFCETPTPNITRPYGACVTGSVLTDVWIEAVGNAWIYGSGSNAAFFNDVITNTGYDGTDSSYAATNLARKALIQVQAFQYNTIIASNWSNYDLFSTAIINAASTCSNNMWINDPQFVAGASGAKPALVCGDIRFNNFHNFDGSGRFYTAGTTLTAGQPVFDAGQLLVKPFADGKPFAGVAATAASSGNAVAVFNNITYFPMVKANINTHINTGAFIGVTTGGVIPLPDQTGAIGVAWYGSGAGQATVQVSLDPLANRGSTGAALNLTASGSSCSNGYRMTATTNDFSTVASGTAAILPPAANGQDIMVMNDGANPLLICPNASMQIGPSGKVGVGVALPSGSSAIFRQVSSTMWRQRLAN